MITELNMKNITLRSIRSTSKIKRICCKLKNEWKKMKEKNITPVVTEHTLGK